MLRILDQVVLSNINNNRSRLLVLVGISLESRVATLMVVTQLRPVELLLPRRDPLNDITKVELFPPKN